MADFPPPSDPNRSADLRRRLLAGIPGALPNFAGLPSPVNDAALDQLRSENAQLTRLLEEMRPILEEATRQETAFQGQVEELKVREQELLRQIEERDGQVQLLTEQIHELEGHITEQAAKAKEYKPRPNKTKLPPWPAESSKS